MWFFHILLEIVQLSSIPILIHPVLQSLLALLDGCFRIVKLRPIVVLQFILLSSLRKHILHEVLQNAVRVRRVQRTLHFRFLRRW
jgi:hypothetical protein